MRAMQTYKIDVSAWCPACETRFKVNLKQIIALKDGFLCLINEHTKCKRYGCDCDKVFFTARTGPCQSWTVLLGDGADPEMQEQDQPS